MARTYAQRPRNGGPRRKGTPPPKIGPVELPSAGGAPGQERPGPRRRLMMEETAVRDAIDQMAVLTAGLGGPLALLSHAAQGEQEDGIILEVDPAAARVALSV